MKETTAAFVSSKSCGDHSLYKFSSFLTNASYFKDTGMLDFQLRAFALADIFDVNTTTNMYTTMHLTITYVDEVLVSKYLRLCDFVDVNHMTSYYVPSGVFSGIDHLFTRGGTATQTITTLIELNGTKTSTSIVEKSTVAKVTDSLVNKTADDTDILPVGIQKRLYDQSFGTSRVNSSGIYSQPWNPSFTTKFLEPSEIPTSRFGNAKYQNSLEAVQAFTFPDSIRTVEVVESTTVTPYAQIPTQSAASAYNSTSTSCPIFKDNEITISISEHVGHRSAMGSFEIIVEIIDPDAEHETIGYGLTIFFAVLLAFIFISNITNIFLSPYQDSEDVYLMPAAMICNAPLLNQVTPSFVDFFRYLQFIFFMVALNLHYPGFLSPLVGSFRWVALLGVKSISNDSSGDVYQTIYSGGLKSLLDGSGTHPMSIQWGWLIGDFFILVGSYIIIHNTLFGVIYLIKKLKRKSVGGYSRRRFIYYNVGVLLSSFLTLATIPLLSISLYVVSTAQSSPYGGPRMGDHFYTWCVATASIILALYIIAVLFFGLRYVYFKRSRKILYTKLSVMLLWNWIYSGFNVSKVSFVLIDQIETLAFAIAIGCLQANIPDYRERGDLIEIPFYSDNCSLFTAETFADLATMPPLSPSVSQLLHDNSSTQGITENRDDEAEIVLVSSTPYHQRTTKDWTEREVDFYYNAQRVLDPDPEVRQLWEERGRKLQVAKNAIASKTMEKVQTPMSNIRIENLDGTNNFLKRVRQFGFGSLISGRFRVKRQQPKSFEVMRPHQRIIKHQGGVIGSDNSVESATIMNTSDCDDDEKKAPESDLSANKHNSLGSTAAGSISDESILVTPISATNKYRLRVVNTASFSSTNDTSDC
ncbi:hypothetical protein HII12_004245 [Brettanomyces bruxellensis]|uniref:Uncharacterized protein n=1 Tax=Dekkera bruxellensis TaxID=5007 RepID=A0A8H6BAG1_DEKBR|nr:hypothetical protein HII12_004245 [Brettanomyces bruxellensis]